jgi:hypothetical protein
MRFDEFTEPVQNHERLNPRIWTEQGDLDPQVRSALLRITREFLGSTKVKIPVKDITVSGSNAGYGYTHDSDIDLHIIADFDDVDCEGSKKELFDKVTKLWKERHHVRIHDIPVEVYVQDSNEPHVSQAIYSVLKRGWIHHARPSRSSYDRQQVAYWVSRWENLIDRARSTGNAQVLEQLMDLLKRYRKQGLDSARGELSTPNLVFKSLRNAGEIGRLVQSMTSMQDRDLGLPEQG